MYDQGPSHPTMSKTAAADVTALSAFPSSCSSMRTPIRPAPPGCAVPATRNGPTLPRDMNMTCQLTACSFRVPASSAARSMAAVSRTTCWGPMCSAASGDASSTLSSGSVQ